MKKGFIWIGVYGVALYIVLMVLACTFLNVRIDGINNELDLKIKSEMETDRDLELSNQGELDLKKR